LVADHVGVATASGDVVARAVLGLMVEAGSSWSTVVVVGGVIAMATTPIIAFALKSSAAYVASVVWCCAGSVAVC